MAYVTSTLALLDKHVFLNLATLLDANKPSGWLVTSAFPEDDPAAFPCIVVRPADTTITTPTLERSAKKGTALVTIKIWTLASGRKEELDTGRDYVRSELLNGFSTLKTYKLALSTKGDAIKDTSNTEEIRNGEKFNTATILVSLVKL